MNFVRSETFDLICGMESNLGTIEDLLTALDAMADSIHGDLPQIASSLQRLVNLAMRECKSAEEARGKLFHINHPTIVRKENAA